MKQNMSNPYARNFSRLLGEWECIHPNVTFGENVQIGDGVVIEEWCVIGDNVIIGHNTILRPNTLIGNDSVIGHLVVSEGSNMIGNRVLIHSQCHITKLVTIEDDVFIAPFFCIANTPRIVHGRNYDLELKPGWIKRAARIGVSVTVLPGLTIGENTLIGAGSVVTHNVPDGEIWFGNPAVKHGDVLREEWL
jgi:UDP-2-acetamido-3-amino-2,3-dideoxy-glucuronate N-acetyltransferase